MDAPSLPDLIHKRKQRLSDPTGRDVCVLSERHVAELAQQCGCPLRAVHAAALRLDIWPHRYLRNRETFSAGEQLRLAESTVAVVGAGGLGGNVILLLARTGVGRLKVVDGDAFDESNLNRQALAGTADIGTAKAEQAVRVVAGINPAVDVEPCPVRLDASNAVQILTGAQVIVDALDNVAGRFVLQDAARALNVPLVHGAVAGFDGQMMTILPGEPGLARLYGAPEAVDDARPDRPELVLGVPAATACTIGALQATEVVKILLGRGKLLRNRLYHIGLEQGRIGTFSFGED
ncbi:MAG: HesA/MoeB/ThiF family protein [Kiritimatiellae bacterium]|nr:HesA/MoeB/ThiF family protein [Kiritimatiellia bacterium]